MTRLIWSKPEDRRFETGLDRGVLYPKNGNAVPWNGLTSVDEAGGDSTVPYYIDGRPFMYFAPPKEFSASIKAYTYPDAFAEVVGFPEVADGMYLDSQVGDSFDMCYRTTIGSLAEGQEAAHKIHLVYNAVVAPSGVSYETLSDSINPSEFSWEIQAAPVAVTGHRPTAHIVIDTRHIEPERLSTIEAMIYGDSDSAPAMPEPQILLDLLKFSNDIVITDFGNGEWAAEGSYRRVYMLDDGTFQLEDANVVDHGDGTYSISSTDEV